jgi:peptidoglycan/LPS O-acetylase OafA/YrhL
MRLDNDALAPTRETPNPHRYMPGLDVIRGIAITAVFLVHCEVLAPQSLTTRSDWVRGAFDILARGYLGVHLFFVLSGFLITGILLDSKRDVTYFQPFYARRIVRILPAYILMIFVLVVSGWISFGYALTSVLFLSNMPSLLHVRPEYGPFWSLSVEEQFYLLWPLVVRKLKIRYLLTLSIAVVVLTPLLKYVIVEYAPSRFGDIRYKTWVLSDFLLAGGLLAILVRSNLSALKLRRIGWSLVAFGFIALVLGRGMDRSESSLALAFALEPPLLLFSGCTLVAFCYPWIGMNYVGRIFAFLGAISYGLYLVHQFVLTMVYTRIQIHGDEAINFLLQTSIAAMLAVVIATLSRYTFEAFFLRMRWRKAGVSSRPKLSKRFGERNNHIPTERHAA